MHPSHPHSSKFNLFQEVMALWEEAHPYNATHIVRLRGRADLPRLQSAIQSACHVAGVGALVLDREGGHYHFEPAESIELHRIEGRGSAAESLHETINEQMNTAFPDEPNHPVRWMVLEDPGSDSHFLIAVWRHLPADDYAIRLLIRRVLNRYFGTLHPDDHTPLAVFAPDYAHVMRCHYRRLGYFRTLVRETRRHHRLRSVHRMGGSPGEGDQPRYCMIEAPEALMRRLALGCRARQVTVNDALLAALAAALVDLTPHRFFHPRRHGLALGSAVNVRHEASQDLSNCFGQFLGHWVIIIDPADLTCLEELLLRIAARTRVEKAEKRAVGPHWNFWMAARVARWLWPAGSPGWYRKVYPLSAGVSHVKLNASWFRGARDHLLDYIRVSPTGPALPLILATARLGDRLHLSLGYQPSCLSPAEAGILVRLLLERLDLLAVASPPRSRHAP